MTMDKAWGAEEWDALAEDAEAKQLDGYDARVQTHIARIARATAATLRAEANKVQCRHCGHRWTPRVPNPRKCPGCGRSGWRTTEEG